MKKTFILIAACFMSMIASAQILEVVSMQHLPTASYDDARVAAISPMGDYVLMTSGSFIGLQRVDLTSGQTNVISKAEGAGYDVKISHDGKELMFREAKYDIHNNQTYNFVRADFQANTKSVVAKKQNSNITPLVEKANIVLINDECKLWIEKNGKKIAIAPQGEEVNYIWGSLSPDKTKILYYVSELGCHVCDINGKNSQFIGWDCTAPCWYDNNTIIAMNDQDDGTYTISSSIVAYTLDGKYQVLTSPDMIAMYPAAVNGKVVFSTTQGETYVLNVK